MTKTLWLLRHAKSDHFVDLDDHDRPLNSRGKKSCKVIGNFLKDQSETPDHVYSSSSARTTDTIKRTLQAAALDTPINYDRALYLATPGEIIRFVNKQASDDLQSIMLVGHNPGMQQLTLLLAKTLPPEYFSEISKKFPTSSLVKFSCNIESWQDLEPATCKLEHFVTPKLIRM